MVINISLAVWCDVFSCMLFLVCCCSVCGGSETSRLSSRSDLSVVVGRKRRNDSEQRRVGEMKCPECGNKIVHQNGCCYCPSCGWEACGA